MKIDKFCEKAWGAEFLPLPASGVWDQSDFILKRSFWTFGSEVKLTAGLCKYLIIFGAVFFSQSSRRIGNFHSLLFLSPFHSTFPSFHVGDFCFVVRVAFFHNEFSSDNRKTAQNSRIDFWKERSLKYLSFLPSSYFAVRLKIVFKRSYEGRIKVLVFPFKESVLWTLFFNSYLHFTIFLRLIVLYKLFLNLQI